MNVQSILLGLLASVLAGLATALGAALIFVLRSRLSAALEDALLSVAAGIMLAASMFSLIVPGLELTSSQGYSPLAGAAQVVCGMFLGMVLLAAIHRVLPHEHFVTGRENDPGRQWQRMWLFVIAITIHNIPEGMAVGVGFGSGETMRALPLALGIGAQNIPEGFAVAAALLAIRYSVWKSFLISALTGLLEAVGGLLGILMSSFSHVVLPAVLGLAAGAMLFVISDEIIPETHRRGNQALATWSLMFGFCAMLLLDAAFR